MNARSKWMAALAIIVAAFVSTVLFRYVPPVAPAYAQGFGVVADFTTTGDTTPVVTPGTVYKQLSTGCTYQYVLHNSGTGAVATTAGAVAYIKTLATYEVTSDMSDGINAGPNSVCGAYLSVAVTGKYVWIQVLGPYATLDTNGDDDIAAGAALIGGTDVVCDSVASGTAATYKVLGYSTAADVDANDTVATHLTIGPM